MVDPRRLAALQIQVDALADQLANAPDAAVNSAIADLRKAVKTTHDIVSDRDLFLTIPPDYEPPRKKPRGLLAMQIQVDALGDELAKAQDHTVNSAIADLRKAIKTTGDIVSAGGRLTIPPDYEPPKGRP